MKGVKSKKSSFDYNKSTKKKKKKSKSYDKN